MSVVRGLSVVGMCALQLSQKAKDMFPPRILPEEILPKLSKDGDKHLCFIPSASTSLFLKSCLCLPIAFYILRHIYLKFVLKIASTIFQLPVIMKGHDTMSRVHR